MFLMLKKGRFSNTDFRLERFDFSRAADFLLARRWRKRYWTLILRSIILDSQARTDKSEECERSVQVSVRRSGSLTQIGLRVLILETHGTLASTAWVSPFTVARGDHTACDTPTPPGHACRCALERMRSAAAVQPRCPAGRSTAK